MRVSVFLRAGATSDEMDVERILVRTRVLPELRAQFAGVGLEIDVFEAPPVADRAALMNVIDRVWRSSPLFVAILGQRYGAELAVAPTRTLEGPHRWLEERLPCSQLDAEVSAALESAGGAGAGLFYVRDPAFVATIAPAQRLRYEPDAAAGRLEDLLKRISSAGGSVARFSRNEPDTFTERLVADLGRLIRARFVGSTITSVVLARGAEKDRAGETRAGGVDPDGSAVTRDGQSTASASPAREVDVACDEELRRAAQDRQPEEPLRDLPCEIASFTVLRTLGRGGMGVVYAAVQKHLGDRPVALKLVRPGPVAGTRERRFEFERAVLARMQHPNIVTLYEAGRTTDGLLYMAMEQLVGWNILQHCDRHRLGVAQRLALFAELCDATAAIHGKGVVHRNLSPQNILVAAAGDRAWLKVIDFGIARTIDPRDPLQAPSEPPGAVYGSLAYMAPEQAGGSSTLDQRADVYVLGTVLYELLTGRRALEVDEAEVLDVPRLVKRILHESVPLMSEFYASAGRSAERAAALRAGQTARGMARLLRGELDELVRGCLRKTLEKRRGTAHELARDVRAWRPRRGWFG